MDRLRLLLFLCGLFVVETAKIRIACEHKSLKIYCGLHRTIRILDASYGRLNRYICRSGPNPSGTASCDVSSASNVVRRACHGKHWCTIRASNSVFGDPCWGTYKYLRVHYSCVPASSPLVSICEHQRRTITCPRGKVIDIITAVYGRRNRTICPRGHTRTTSCAASKSAKIVMANCNRKRVCTLHASNSVFGDPCWGVFKYLSYKYRCIG